MKAEGLIQGTSETTPLLNRATGVFRVVTECHYGPTKGSESPLVTEGRVRGVSPLNNL